MTKLLLGEDMSDDKTEASTKPEEEDGGEKDGDSYRHPYLNKTGELMSMSALSTLRLFNFFPQLIIYH